MELIKLGRRNDLFKWNIEINFQERIIQAKLNYVEIM